MKHTCRQVVTKVNENVIADSFSVIPTCSESLFQPWLISRGEKERFWTSQNDKDGYFQVKPSRALAHKGTMKMSLLRNQESRNLKHWIPVYTGITD
jgi:hypothetical protein